MIPSIMRKRILLPFLLLLLPLWFQCADSRRSSSSRSSRSGVTTSISMMTRYSTKKQHDTSWSLQNTQIPAVPFLPNNTSASCVVFMIRGGGSGSGGQGEFHLEEEEDDDDDNENDHENDESVVDLDDEANNVDENEDDTSADTFEEEEVDHSESGDTLDHDEEEEEEEEDEVNDESDTASRNNAITKNPDTSNSDENDTTTDGDDDDDDDDVDVDDPTDHTTGFIDTAASNEENTNDADNNNSYAEEEEEDDAEEEISIDTSLINALINDPDVRVKRPTVMHNEDDSNDDNDDDNDDTDNEDKPTDNATSENSRSEDDNDNNNNNNDDDHHPLDERIMINSMDHDTTQFTSSHENDKRRRESNNNSNNDSDMVQTNKNATGTNATMDSNHVTDNDSNVVTTTATTIAHKIIPDDDDEHSNVPVRMDDDDTLRTVLRDTLQYQQDEVDRLKPNIARMIVTNRLFRPPEGVPTHWLSLPHSPTSPNTGISSSRIYQLRRILIRRIIPAMIVSLAVIVASPNIPTISSSIIPKSPTRTMKAIPIASVPKPLLLDTVASNHTLSSTTPESVESSHTSDKLPMPTSSSISSSSNIIRPDVVAKSKSLKPLTNHHPQRVERPVDLDITWLDKFITMMEQKLKSIFQ